MRKICDSSRYLHHRAIDFERARQIVADWLFDDDAREVRRGRRGDQTGLGQPLDRVANRLGRYRQVVNAIGREAARLFDSFKFSFKFCETVGTVEAGQVVEAVGELRPARLVDLQARESGRPVVRAFAEIVERHFAPRESQHRALRRHHALAARDEIVQRRNQLALGEIAGRAENHDRAWRRRLRSLYS